MVSYSQRTQLEAPHARGRGASLAHVVLDLRASADERQQHKNGMSMVVACLGGRRGAVGMEATRGRALSGAPTAIRLCQIRVGGAARAAVAARRAAGHGLAAEVVVGRGKVRAVAALISRCVAPGVGQGKRPVASTWKASAWTTRSAGLLGPMSPTKNAKN